jgi:hypothetical protein
MRIPCLIILIASTALAANYPCKNPFPGHATHFYLIGSGDRTWISPSPHLPNRTAPYFKFDCLTDEVTFQKEVALYQGMTNLTNSTPRLPRQRDLGQRMGNASHHNGMQ